MQSSCLLQAFIAAAVPAMSGSDSFNAAAEEVKQLKATPADDELLELYALFKQGTVGDVNTARPGMLDFKGKYKWDAWEKKKGMSQDAAQEAYVAKVNELVQKYGKN